ncbi:MAG: hypothetical protein AB7Q17_06265 [Phycisphaerae bacterium]
MRHSTIAARWAAGILVGTAASLAVAGSDYTLSLLLYETQAAPDGSLITDISTVAVNDAGDWFVTVTTDNADPDLRFVMIRNGTQFARENDALAAPVGSNISSFDSQRINANGDAGWNLFLRNTGGTTNDSGIFFNTTLLIQESAVSNATDFSPGTPYIGFFEVRMNDANQLASVLSVDDPAITTSVDRALMRLDYDPGMGILTEAVVYKEGDVLPGQEQALTDFGTTHDTFGFNNAGDVLYVASLTGNTATNGVIYRNDTLIAQKGDPSPVDARTYANIGTSTKVAINDAGDVVFKASLAGDLATDTILIRNGQKFMQEGDLAPQVGGETLTGFGTGPVWINDLGVVWYGAWTGATANNHGLFLNDQLLIRRGVTTIDGFNVTTVAGSVNGSGGISNGFETSPNGRYIILRAVIEDPANPGVFPTAVLLLTRAGLPGDMNCDGVVNNFDIDPFVLALTDAAAYEATFPNCDINNADASGDGLINNFDIDPFVALITGG